MLHICAVWLPKPGLLSEEIEAIPLRECLQGNALDHRDPPDGYGVYPDGVPEDRGMNPGLWDYLDFSVFPTITAATQEMASIILTEGYRSKLCEGDCTTHRGRVRRYYAYVPKLAKETTTLYCDQAVEDARNAGFTVTRI